MHVRGASPFNQGIKSMKKNLLALAILCATTTGAAYAQQDGQWLVRARAVHIDSDNGGAAGAAGVSINNKWIPEVDVSYFFTPNFAAEVILTYPQEHDVRLHGGQIGTIKHLAPSVLGQYYFTGLGAFKPYVGAGINYTRFSGVNIAGGAVTVKKNSWGPALQLGFDYALDKNWSVNFDVKKIYIDTDVSAGFGKYKVDPLLLGVGVGYRF